MTRFFYFFLKISERGDIFDSIYLPGGGVLPLILGYYGV